MGGLLNDKAVDEHILPNFAPYIYSQVPKPAGDVALTRAELFHRLRNYDLYTCDVLISPIITGGHITSVIADRRSRAIVHWDSSGNGDPSYATEFNTFLQEHWEWRVAHGGPEVGPYPMQGLWTCKGSNSREAPQQRDDISCGIYEITIATLTLLQIPPHYFTHDLVPRMRLHVAQCILSQACPLPWCINDQGLRLGIVIASGISHRQYRQNIRPGIQDNPTVILRRATDAQCRGRYIEIDQEKLTALHDPTGTPTTISTSLPSGSPH
jgi:hypothetical protein